MRHRSTPLLLLLATFGLAACKDGSDKQQIDTGPWDDDGDGVVAREDCDDSYPEIGGPTTWYADEDGDGHGDASNSQESCNQPSGYVDNAEDCDDSTEFVSPIAKERCDGQDNDCDTEVDEDDSIDAVVWYPDADNDEYGDPEQPTPKCDQPRGYVEDSSDCDDTSAEINPLACEVCGDDIDNDCDGVEVCDGLGQADLILRGEAPGDAAGTQARNAGDMNGDGFSDIAVAAPGAASDAGTIYVVTGPLTGELSLAFAWASVTGDAGSSAGKGLAALGDVDGDGYSEIMVGAPGGNHAWVWGGPDQSVSATFTGETEGEEAGKGVARLGDFDGDGEHDFVVGSPASDEGSEDGGAVYVVYGPVSGTFDLYESDAVWYGDAEGQRAGDALTGAGDMDGDGYEDFIFGADGLGSSSATVGAVYVVFGPQVGLFGTDDVDVKWFGEAVGEAAAYPAGIGDVSGDGLDDVAIAVPGAEDDDHPKSGAVYIWYGAGYTVIDNVNRGDASLWGEEDLDFLFLPVNGTDGGYGDQNADGYGEFLVSALASDYSATDAGASYLLYGPLSGELSLCDSDVHFYGEAANDASGTSSTGAGDFNDDGVPDLLTGAPGNEGGAGAAYVIFGAGWVE